MKIILFCLVAMFFSSDLTLAGADSFPLEIKGKTLNIQVGATRGEIVSSLKKIFVTEEPSVSTPEYLQYDYVATQGEGALMLSFDFNKAGVLAGIKIDAYMKQQNPVATRLVGWLKQNAGPGKKKNKDTQWEKSGFVFKFKEVKNAGEDSCYGVEVVKKK